MQKDSIEKNNSNKCFQNTLIGELNYRDLPYDYERVTHIELR